MELVNHLDFWLAVLTLLALVYYTLGDWLRPVVGPLRTLVRPLGGLLGAAITRSGGAARSADAAQPPARRVRARSAVQHARQARSRRQNANPARVPRAESAVPRSGDAADPAPTWDELRAIARAIELRASGAANGKQQALLQAFSPPEFTAYKVSKGAGEGWQRASRLWDLLAPGSRPGQAAQEAPKGHST